MIERRFFKILFGFCFCFYLSGVAIFYNRISLGERELAKLKQQIQASEGKDSPNALVDQTRHQETTYQFQNDKKQGVPGNQAGRLRHLESNSIKKTESKSSMKINRKNVKRLHRGKHGASTPQPNLQTGRRVGNAISTTTHQPKLIRSMKLSTVSQVYRRRVNSNEQRNPLIAKQPLQPAPRKSKTNRKINQSLRLKERPGERDGTKAETRKGKFIQRNARQKLLINKANKLRQEITTSAPRVQNKAARTSLIVPTGTQQINTTRRLFSVDFAKPLPPISHSNFTEIVKEVYLYSAYFDDRNGENFIRMITIGESYPLYRRNLFCHFYYFHNESSFHIAVKEGVFYRTCEDHAQSYAAFVISCPVPEPITLQHVLRNSVRVFASDSVSLGGAMKVVKIVNNRVEKRQRKMSINVCIPPLFGDIDTDKLIEFIELTKLLGADHFSFHLHNVNENVRNMLKMYVNFKQASTLPWDLPIKSEKIWYYGQSVSVWDCLYRNMYYYDFIAFNDIDEFIFPTKNMSWREMLSVFNETENYNGTVAGYRFQSAFFDNGERERGHFHDDVKSLLTMNTIWRAETLSNIRTKLIVDPLKIFEIGIHHLSKPAAEHYSAVDVSPEVALLRHYRPCEETYGMVCDKYRKDTLSWRYLDKLKANVEEAKKLVARYLKSLNRKL